MIAQRFGHGLYRIVCGNGPSARRNATIEVTPEYAESAGWAAPPPQMEPMNPIQLQAARTFQQAQQGPVPPLDLAAMIQTAVDSALAKVRPQESGLDSFMKGFSTANELSLRAMEQAKTMLGMNPVQAEPKEASWADVVLQVAPTILEGLKSIMAPAQPTQPSTAVQTVAQPAIQQHQETPAMPQNQQVYPVPPEATRPLLNLMHQYADMIRPHLEGPASPQELAAQLSSLVGEALDPSIRATAEYVKANGPALLGHVAPFFATEKAAQVVIEWAAIITEDPGGE